jgi:hypothetical protein
MKMSSALRLVEARLSEDGSVAVVAQRGSDRLCRGRIAFERASSGGFWGPRAVVARRRGLALGCQRALGCVVGVVDPGAKRRIWG